MSTRDFSRELRRNSTDAENRLWMHLRDRRFGGIKFRRQRPIGPYIVDFISLENHLIIEVDGSQHRDAADLDAQRTAYLAGQGYAVLRFWNDEVLNKTDQVLEAIWRAIKA